MSKKKGDAKVVHTVQLPKSVKCMAIAMPRGKKRGYLRAMTSAEDNYQEWRRNGFKGAWWWQYFKGQDAA